MNRLAATRLLIAASIIPGCDAYTDPLHVQKVIRCEIGLVIRAETDNLLVG